MGLNSKQLRTLAILQPEMSRAAELKKHICEVGRTLYSRGLIGGCEGNISCRLEPGKLLCTPSELCKGEMTPDHIVTISESGDMIEGDGLPSSEIRIHLLSYRERPDCEAVVHAHPPTATGMTLAGKTIPHDVMPEAGFILGPVALCKFGMPGTDELPATLLPFIHNHKTFLLSHHGALTLGSSLTDACHRMESLEQVAKALLTAHLFGGAKSLPESALRVMKEKALHGRLT